MKREKVYIGNENLSENLVTEGTVKKYPIYVNNASNEITEISILELSQGAKIKFHVHQEDSEIYYMLGTKEYKCVTLGEGHSLENRTNEILIVLSIKSKQDLKDLNKVKEMFPYLLKYEEEEHFNGLEVMMRYYDSIII